MTPVEVRMTLVEACKSVVERHGRLPPDSAGTQGLETLCTVVGCFGRTREER